MSKIAKSARNEHCLVRIDGVCNFDDSTTVLAHIGGGGMAYKNNDIEASYCCSSCHDVLDGRVQTKFSKDLLDLWHHQGAMRTRAKLIEKGLILIT